MRKGKQLAAKTLEFLFQGAKFRFRADRLARASDFLEMERSRDGSMRAEETQRAL